MKLNRKGSERWLEKEKERQKEWINCFFLGGGAGRGIKFCHIQVGFHTHKPKLFSQQWFVHENFCCEI